MRRRIDSGGGDEPDGEPHFTHAQTSELADDHTTTETSSTKDNGSTSTRGHDVDQVAAMIVAARDVCGFILLHGVWVASLTACAVVIVQIIVCIVLYRINLVLMVFATNLLKATYEETNDLFFPGVESSTSVLQSSPTEVKAQTGVKAAASTEEQDNKEQETSTVSNANHTTATEGRYNNATSSATSTHTNHDSSFYKHAIDMPNPSFVNDINATRHNNETLHVPQPAMQANAKGPKQFDLQEQLAEAKRFNATATRGSSKRNKQRRSSPPFSSSASIATRTRSKQKDNLSIAAKVRGRGGVIPHLDLVSRSERFLPQMEPVPLPEGFIPPHLRKVQGPELAKPADENPDPLLESMTPSADHASTELHQQIPEDKPEDSHISHDGAQDTPQMLTENPWASTMTGTSAAAATMAATPKSRIVYSRQDLMNKEQEYGLDVEFTLATENNCKRCGRHPLSPNSDDCCVPCATVNNRIDAAQSVITEQNESSKVGCDSGPQYKKLTFCESCGQTGHDTEQCTFRPLALCDYCESYHGEFCAQAAMNQSTSSFNIAEQQDKSDDQAKAEPASPCDSGTGRRIDTQSKNEVVAPADGPVAQSPPGGGYLNDLVGLNFDVADHSIDIREHKHASAESMIDDPKTENTTGNTTERAELSETRAKEVTAPDVVNRQSNGSPPKMPPGLGPAVPARQIIFDSLVPAQHHKSAAHFQSGNRFRKPQQSTLARKMKMMMDNQRDFDRLINTEFSQQPVVEHSSADGSGFPMTEDVIDPLIVPGDSNIEGARQDPKKDWSGPRDITERREKSSGRLGNKVRDRAIQEAREALRHAWLERESVRARAQGCFTLEVMQELAKATRPYLDLRTALAKSMPGGELVEIDALMYPVLSKSDRRAPKTRPPADRNDKREKQRATDTVEDATHNDKREQQRANDTADEENVNTVPEKSAVELMQGLVSTASTL